MSPNPIIFPLTPRDPRAKKNYCRFEWVTSKNEKASLEAGRPVHDKVLRAIVMSPGSKNSEAVRRVKTVRHDGTVKIRQQSLDEIDGLEEALALFEKGERPPEGSGTPLEAWPTLDMALIADLKALNIHFVETIAELDDQSLMRVGMGGRKLQAQARAYIESARGNAPAEALAARNAELEARIESLEQALKAQKKDEKAA